MTPPRPKSALARWLPLLLGAIAFLFLLATQDRRVGMYDEGSMLLGAERVLLGELPYRDFWTMYPPGQFYTLAWLFHGFGSSVLVERMWDLLVRTGIIVVVYRLLDRASSRTLALVGSSVVGVWLSGLGSHGFPVFPALLGSLAAVDLLAPRFHGRVSLRRHAAAGACVGLTTLFRHDLGLYAAVATGAILLLHWRRGSGPEARRPAPIALFALGGLAVTAPVLVWLLSAIPAGDLWFSLIETPARNYPRFRSLPFPSWIDIFRSVSRTGNIGSLDHLAVHLPILAGATALAAFVVAERRDTRAGAAIDPEAAGKRWTLALLGTLSLLFFVKGMVRVSPLHMSPAIVTSIVTLLVLARPPGRLPRVLGLAGILGGLLLTVASLPMASLVWSHGAGAADRLSRGDACQAPPGLERSSCFDVDPNPLRAIQYVQAHSRPGDYLYVGAARHDRLMVNDIAFYFLADRRCPTRWYHLEPGIQTTAVVQDSMVAELTARPPGLVVLSAEWEQAWEPNESQYSSGVTILDRFIADHYEPAAFFGPIAVLKRRTP